MSPEPLFDRLLRNLPEGEVLNVHVGLYWTAVIVRVDGIKRCGLAATVGDESHHYTRQPAIPEAGSLAGMPARALAGLVRSPRLPEVSIGMAAVNALLPRLPERWVDLNAEQIIARHGAGKKVALVGHFPFTERLRERLRTQGGTLAVLEQNPGEGDLPASMAPEIIPQADILAITAMTLLNHTFDGLISLRRPQALALLIGPTTPLSPLLFETGLDMLSGAVVEDVESTLRGLSQGANFHQLHQMGVRLVSMTALSSLLVPFVGEK
jgi:uncharacterized protein